MRQTTTHGYHYVGMYRGGKIIRARVHRLVLEAFVGPQPDGMDGCHRDDDKDNNTLDNLYWGTKIENMADQVRNGGHHLAGRESCANGHLFDETNTYYRPDSGHRQCKRCQYERNKARRLAR